MKQLLNFAQYMELSNTSFMPWCTIQNTKKCTVFNYLPPASFNCQVTIPWDLLSAHVYPPGTVYTLNYPNWLGVRIIEVIQIPYESHSFLFRYWDMPQVDTIWNEINKCIFHVTMIVCFTCEHHHHMHNWIPRKKEWNKCKKEVI